MKRDALERYNDMRDFEVTGEPSGRVGQTDTGRSFVVQKHAATRLHYDFRLEWNGTLLSWAVPKGPSLSPGDKRLAVQVEDHPIDYRDFEGTIPKGQYGGGEVIVWDRGTWTPNGDVDASLKKGRLDFELAGEKLHGRFILVRTRQNEGKKPSWLLMKRTDAHATGKRGAPSIVDERPESILTGRTIEDIAAGVPVRKSRSGAPTRSASPSPSPMPKPASIAPELATLVKEVPAGDEWIYEIKYDGYRTLAWLEDGKVTMFSRRGLDWTKTYAPIASALARVRAKSAIFDGEVAWVGDDGRTSFQELQAALGSKAANARARLVYYVFDLLHYDGTDLTDQPLSYRKERLRTILAGESAPLAMSDHVENGAAFFREACKIGLEGIIGKRKDRPYRSGRSTDWIKVKCQRRQELVIVGFTPPKGGRTGIGALLLGVREGKTLRYAGKVGTGFSNETLRDLAKRLGERETETSSVSGAPRIRDARWVKPDLVAEVRFTEWTKDGVLRHPSFEGLRLDKPARDVTREEPKALPKTKTKPAKDGVHGITVSHPERVMDAKSGLTKLELVRYVGDVADAMLPYVAKRPLMLFRCPGGTQEATFRQSDRRAGKKTSCFVQKHGGQGLASDKIGHAKLDGEEALFVETAAHLVTLAQHNTVEVHGWGSTLPRWERPDWIVLDLDPDEALPFSRVVDAAFELKAALETVSLASWVKTTGGKGLHVVVPIARRWDWETVKGVSLQIATLIARAAPSRYVVNMSKKARTGKIFIDYLRNAEGATAVLPYSPRARPGLPVALPIAWKDLRAVHPLELTIATVPALLARRRVDPWADLLETRQTIPRALLEAARAE